MRRTALGMACGLLGNLAFPMAFSRTELFPSGFNEPLAFVCLVPGLLAIKGLPPRRALWAGFLIGLGFFVPLLWWVASAVIQFTPLPWIAGVGLMLLLATLCAMCWAPAFFLGRLFEERHGWAVGLTLAPAWMACELLRNYFVTGLPWGSLGHSQARNLWLSQFASVGGVYGVALLVAFVNGALYELLRAVVLKERGMPKALLAGAGGALIAVHLYGALRVRAWDERIARAPRAKVAFVQGNIDERLKLLQAAAKAVTLAAYNPPTNAADASGADLIVWPETAFPEAFEIGKVSSLAGRGLSNSRYHASLLLGVELFDRADQRSVNGAFLLDPGLSLITAYQKHHLVLLGEYVPAWLEKYLPFTALAGRYKPGERLEAVDFQTPTGRAKLGIEICFDAVFPEISREYASQGAQILVNMTNDAWWGFSGAPWQFLRMVQSRAVETGRPVVRAANTGSSAFIDPLGRVSQATELGLVESDGTWADLAAKVPPEWRMASLPLLTELTPYVVIGDVPAYLATLFCLVGAGWAVLRGRSHAGRRE